MFLFEHLEHLGLRAVLQELPGPVNRRRRELQLLAERLRRRRRQRAFGVQRPQIDRHITSRGMLRRPACC